MKVLLKPFVFFVSRLKYGGKFIAVSLLFAIPLVLLMYTYVTEHQSGINATKQHQYGVTQVNEVMPLILLVQQHRGLMNGYLNGNVESKFAIDERQTEIAQRIAHLNKIFNSDKLASSKMDWQGIQEKWETLSASAESMRANDSFKEHTDLIEDIQRFIVDLADETELSLSNDISTSYLTSLLVEELPALIEHTAIIRGRGNGVLAAGKLSLVLKDELVLQSSQTYADLHSLQKIAKLLVEQTDSLDEQFGVKVQATINAVSTYLLTLNHQIVDRSILAMNPDDFYAEGTATIDVVKEFYGIVHNELDRLLEREKNTLSYSMSFMIAITSVMIILVIMFYLAFYRNVIETVRMIRIKVEDIAKGDFTKGIQLNTKDELSEVGQAINLMQQDMNKVLAQNKFIAERTAASSQELMAISHESTQAMQQIAASIQEVSDGTSSQRNTITETSTAMNEMATGISRIAEAASEAAYVAERATESAEQGDLQLASTVLQMQSIKTTQLESTQVVTKLDEHSAEISEIISAVMDIAQQTKLLSLNANIEAARAGEYGRGFSVVAQEVGKLAEQTSQSGEAISDVLNIIRGLVDEAVVSMNRMQRETDEGMHSIDLSKQMLNHILGDIKVVSEQIEDVSSSSQELAAEMEQVTASIAEVASISEKTSNEAETMAAATEQQLASMEEIQASSEELRDMSQQLQEDMSKFQLKV
ncbi:MAG: methyl-accepting chemotaxis protein [Candidatus Cohnella colombiensis]|uniref:Methyl-accepting chemotaxis protein n=1 Tax=Candidatus Cohnella colombiensis TaxID=3121368 RepID=A0AA95EY50_9BACL|nr:MAG: methyl-accepting chemotaxis protein [Cohnella sp.]